MGPFKGLKQLRRIVEDCVQNKMHPVYHIKVCMFFLVLCASLIFPQEVVLEALSVDYVNWIHILQHLVVQTLMMKKELEKDPALANESWDRFLPTFRKYVPLYS